MTRWITASLEPAARCRIRIAFHEQSPALGPLLSGTPWEPPPDSDSNAFTSLSSSDMETSYKVFRREVLETLDLREDRWSPLTWCSWVSGSTTWVGHRREPWCVPSRVHTKEISRRCARGKVHCAIYGGLGVAASGTETAPCSDSSVLAGRRRPGGEIVLSPIRPSRAGRRWAK